MPTLRKKDKTSKKPSSEEMLNLHSYMKAAARTYPDVDILHHLSQHPSIKGKIDPRALRVMLGAIRSAIGVTAGEIDDQWATPFEQGFRSNMPDVSPTDEYKQPFTEIPIMRRLFGRTNAGNI